MSSLFVEESCCEQSCLALSSLVAVIPAAFMLYLLIMGMMGGMSGMLMIIAGIAIVAGIGVCAIPILGFIMGPKDPAKAKSKKKKDSTVEEADLEGDMILGEEEDEDIESLASDEYIGESDDNWGEEMDEIRSAEFDEESIASDEIEGGAWDDEFEDLDFDDEEDKK